MINFVLASSCLHFQKYFLLFVMLAAHLVCVWQYVCQHVIQSYDEQRCASKTCCLKSMLCWHPSIGSAVEHMVLKDTRWQPGVTRMSQLGSPKQPLQRCVHNCTVPVYVHPHLLLAHVCCLHRCTHDDVKEIQRCTCLACDI